MAIYGNEIKEGAELAVELLDTSKKPSGKYIHCTVMTIRRNLGRIRRVQIKAQTRNGPKMAWVDPKYLANPDHLLPGALLEVNPPQPEDKAIAYNQEGMDNVVGFDEMTKFDREKWDALRKAQAAE